MEENTMATEEVSSDVSTEQAQEATAAETPVPPQEIATDLTVEEIISGINNDMTNAEAEFISSLNYKLLMDNYTEEDIKAIISAVSINGRTAEYERRVFGDFVTEWPIWKVIVYSVLRVSGAEEGNEN